jgi:hypothetical protein
MSHRPRTTMVMIDAVVITLIVIIGLVIYQATPEVTGRPARPVPSTEPPPCATEDGGPVPCLWDGPNRGAPGEPGARTGRRYTVTAVP